MNKRYFFIVLSVFFASQEMPLTSFSQNIGIGTTLPNPSSAVDITSTSKGLLIPRMKTTAITSIANPAKGLMVYDTLVNQLKVNMGTPVSPNWQTIVAKSGWGLDGNTGTNPETNFLGTTDVAPLVFKVNNARAAYIDTGSYYTHNTSFGFWALSNNNIGKYNTANGYYSLDLNTTGTGNTATGYYSLYSNIAGTGFVAQEVEQAASETGYNFSGVDKPKTDAGLYGLRYAEFVVPLVKAVQEQQQQIETQKLQLKN